MKYHKNKNTVYIIINNNGEIYENHAYADKDYALMTLRCLASSNWHIVRIHLPFILRSLFYIRLKDEKPISNSRFEMPFDFGFNPLSYRHPSVFDADHASKDFIDKLSGQEFYRALCTHRDPHTGKMSLVYDNDQCTCTICGETFRMYKGTEEEVMNTINTMKSILQCTRHLYLDAPTQMVDSYYQITPLLDEIDMDMNLSGTRKYSDRVFSCRRDAIRFCKYRQYKRSDITIQRIRIIRKKNNHKR
jgi:hypothetical protein